MKKICVIGLGYIGLPTACLLANAGNTVYGFDLNTQRIEMLQKAQLPFEEPGLEDIFQKAHSSKRLIATPKMVESDVYLVAVPTPDTNKSADLRYVIQAVQSITEVLKDGDLIIIESTISPAASIKEIKPLLHATGKKYLLAHCPERAIPGKTIDEMIHNDRIIGGLTADAAKKTMDLYQGFVKGKMYLTDITTAECCKLMENTFRDVNIALANEFAIISQEIGINVWEAISLANKHPRVNIHSPGPGVGGHCIPVDPWFFVGASKHAKLISTARDINDGMPQFVVDELLKKIKQYNITKPIVGVLGVSYKKNVGDARETPTTEILQILKAQNIDYAACDPFVDKFTEPLEDLEDVLQKSNVILLVTDHDQFLSVKFEQYKNIKIIYDTRNVLEKEKIKIPVHTLGNGK